MGYSISSSDNIIFNNFLTAKLKYNLDLTATYTYKACLLKASFYSLYTKTDFINTVSTYGFINTAGFECEDLNKNYITGGQYIKFNQEDIKTETSILQKFKLYTSSGYLKWKNVKFKDTRDPLKYILFYRESDGLLLACFGLEYNDTSDFDVDINIAWGNNPVFTIEYTKFSGMSIDNVFSLESTNPIQNSVITKGLIKYGILLEDELSTNPDLPNNYETSTDKGTETTEIDKMTIIKNTDTIVNDIFTEDLAD